MRSVGDCALGAFSVQGEPRGDGMAVTRASLLLGQLGLDLPQPRHGPVDGCRGDQVEIVHADQVKEEVAPQVPLCDVRTTVLHKQHDGLVHLVISYKPGQEVTRWFLDCTFLCFFQKTYDVPVLHDVEVPELHDLLFSLVDIGELLDLLQTNRTR